MRERNSKERCTRAWVSDSMGPEWVDYPHLSSKVAGDKHVQRHLGQQHIPMALNLSFSDR